MEDKTEGWNAERGGGETKPEMVSRRKERFTLPQECSIVALLQ
jgi:hypothetical protein